MDLNMQRADLHGLAPFSDQDAKTHPYGANWLFMKDYLSDPDLACQYGKETLVLTEPEYQAYLSGAMKYGHSRDAAFPLPLYCNPQSCQKHRRVGGKA